MRLFVFILSALQLSFLECHRISKRKDNYCIATNDFSDKLNFTALSNPDKDYSIQHDTGVILRLQICNVLKQSCNSQTDYSICLSKNGYEIGIGKNPPKVVNEFGEFIFKYTGDKCNEQHNYTVQIKMKCDFNAKEADSGLELYAPEYNDCNFNMEWRTTAACHEPKRINCTVNNKYGHYDLSELTKLSGNYEIPVNDSKKILLNVCHSLISSPCPSEQAACLIDLTNNHAQKNLGKPVQNLQYNEDGTLILNYNSGAVCISSDSDQLNNKTYYMQTTITFICDLNAIGTLPFYVGGMEKCHFQFQWKVAAACSEQALQNKSLKEENFGTCSVQNPITGQIFNLKRLMNSEFSVKPYGVTEVYKFNICNAITNTSCKQGTGACRLHNSLSGGIGNANLMWKESGPYLNYTNGDLYFHQRRYTLIEFYCGSQDYEIEKINLYFDVIKFSTPLVCRKQDTCLTYNKQVDLRPLMLQFSNYIIKSNDIEYHINLCQPLVNDHRISICTDEKASICKAQMKNEKVISTTNLGSFDSALVPSSDQSAVIVYRNGSVCEEDKNRRIESSISFFCDITNQKTKPLFKRYSNCTYYFEWKTSLVCGKIEGYFHENCSINNTLGDFRDLSLLGNKTDLVTSVVGKNNASYHISLCGDKKKCNGGFICDDNMNYGTSVSVLYDYTVFPDSIQLHFTGGSRCKDGSPAQSFLNINCNSNVTSNAPVIIEEKPCYLELELNRVQTCRLLSIPKVSTKDDTNRNIVPSESISFSGGAITGIISSILIILMIIFYLQNESRRRHLIEMISNSTTRNCDRVKYSRVNTMEEVHLLLNESDPTVIPSESDDDELLDA